MIPSNHKSHKHLHKISLWSWKKKNRNSVRSKHTRLYIALSGEFKIRLSGIGVGWEAWVMPQDQEDGITVIACLQFIFYAKPQFQNKNHLQ